MAIKLGHLPAMARYLLAFRGGRRTPKIGLGNRRSITLSYEGITGFSSLSLWSSSLHSTTPAQEVANSSPPNEDASIHSST
jgi:hypothetical protein